MENTDVTVCDFDSTHAQRCQMVRRWNCAFKFKDENYIGWWLFDVFNNDKGITNRALFRLVQ